MDDMDERIERAAKAAHEVSRAYCQGLGDNSQPAWEDAPEWQQESARAGVAAILKNPDTTPEQSHKGWLEEKWANGWRYGAVKDPEAKTHPCMVRYEHLPAEHRAKDLLFTTTVKASLAAGLGG